tara:strand:- start:160 stop:387 length:228 start_codon:yes stop_codon:yes gene_type:complete
MFLDEKKIINGMNILIPKNSFRQDEFIGLWRKAQDMALVISHEIDFIKNVDQELDKTTLVNYLKLKNERRNNVCK